VTPPTDKLRRNLKRLQYAFFICGALALGYSAFVLINARLYQKEAARQFEQHVYVNVPDEPSVSEAKPPADGASLARFEIPRLNMDTVVIEGDTDADLRRAIGHIPGTALPGSAGNVGIAGHRDTFFRPLRNVRAGDVISLQTKGATYRYKVESTEVVMPDRSDVLNPTPEPHLTLVTCFPFYYVGSAPKRFIVRAREIQPSAPASPGKEGNLAPATTNLGN
jgi:sortase A